MNKKVVLLTFVFFSLVFSSFGQSEEKSIINIESAEKSEYKKDSVNGADCIILSGSVKISVTKGKDKTTINADNVNYNRQSEMLYAEGNVSLEQTGGSAGGEKITADSLLFNTSTLEGVFDNGRAVQTSSDAINLPSGSTLIVASDIFGRDSGGTIAFKGGELTFCDDENPHWKIRASRIWLLPGGEFAFFSALLFVGRVPLLYLPAFYYPKDELIFNPAMGYDYRKGYFINTTTYLYGRKPEDAASTKSETSENDEKIDVFSFMKTGGMKEQVREGIVLHNLDEDFHGDTTNHVKIMADYYANLGAMIGTDIVFKPSKILTDFQFNVEVGFANEIIQSETSNNVNYYIPYKDGEKVKSETYFLGLKMPFRYQTNLKLAISKPLSLTLSMPIYSDSMFDYDFNKRAETMDWIDYLMSEPPTEDTDSITTITSYTWKLSGNYTFTLPDIVKPYVSSLSLSSFESSIDFTTINSTTNNASVNKPYYPRQIIPLKLNGKISGTIFEYPSTKKSVKVPSTGITLALPEILDDSEKIEKTDDAEELKTEENPEQLAENEAESSREDILFESSLLPVIAGNGSSIQKLNGITYRLTYSVSPYFDSQLSYNNNISNPEDFNWKDLKSTYIEVKSPSTLTSTLGYKDSFLSLTDTFNFNPIYQKHPYFNKDQYNNQNEIDNLKKADYNARKMDLTDTNALTFKPFYYTEHFSNTSLTWNTTVKMIRTKYISDDVENPEWEYLTTDLTDSECVTTHNLNLVLAAKEDDFSQQLSLTTTLPPQVDSYNGTLTLTFPYTTFSAGTGIKKKSATDDTWVKQNLSQSLSVKLLSSKLNLTQSYVYNLEDSEHDSFRFSLSGFGAQLAYTMSYSTAWNFNDSTGWSSGTDKSFQPYTLSLAYANSSKTYKYWTERISIAPTFSTSIVYDYIKPTSSSFTFIPSLTFKVNDFLNITFSAESKNTGIYRYFCSDANFEKYYKSAGYRNPIDDLMDSYRFDDDSKRKASNFKMKNFKILITHELCDWDFNCEWSVKPRLVTNSGSSFYDFSPYFSLSVSWRPMAGMKTEIRDEYGEWSLK